MTDNEKLLSEARELLHQDWDERNEEVEDMIGKLADALEASEARVAELEADHTDSEKTLIDTVNRLAAAIEDAPHERCNTNLSLNYGGYPCNCWKASATTTPEEAE